MKWHLLFDTQPTSSPSSTTTIPPNTTIPGTETIRQEAEAHCPECFGEGHIEVIGSSFEFDERQECWMPSEHLEPCYACHGTGVHERDGLEDEAGAEADRRTHDHDEAAEVSPCAEELPF